jgi:hypothetical protein
MSAMALMSWTVPDLLVGVLDGDQGRLVGDALLQLVKVNEALTVHLQEG